MIEPELLRAEFLPEVEVLLREQTAAPGEGAERGRDEIRAPPGDGKLVPESRPTLHALRLAAP